MKMTYKNNEISGSHIKCRNSTHVENKAFTKYNEFSWFETSLFSHHISQNEHYRQFLKKNSFILLHSITTMILYSLKIRHISLSYLNYGKSELFSLSNQEGVKILMKSVNPLTAINFYQV